MGEDMTAAEFVRAKLTHREGRREFSGSLTEQLLQEHDDLAARIAGLSDEWGIAVEDSSGAVVAEDEDDARRRAANYSRYHVAGCEPSQYYAVRRQVTEWRPADAT